jgi:hypothetical protein
MLCSSAGSLASVGDSVHAFLDTKAANRGRSFGRGGEADKRMSAILQLCLDLNVWCGATFDTVILFRLPNPLDNFFTHA